MLFITKTNFKKWVKIAVAVVVPVIFLSTSFFQNPYYPEDFEDRASLIEFNEEQSVKYNSISSAKTTCFFLATCPFCEIASDYLNDLYVSGQIKDIEIIYYAYQSTADSLVKSRGIQIPYKTIEDNSFFSFSGNSFPVVLHKEQDNQVKKWVGNDVNFACYDYLVSKQ
jgi:glutaredoxin